MSFGAAELQACWGVAFLGGTTFWFEGNPVGYQASFSFLAFRSLPPSLATTCVAYLNGIFHAILVPRV